MHDPFLDATAQAELVRNGEASPAELVDEAIQRIQSIDSALNAVTIPRFEKARAEAQVARGRFSGVPYVIKDHVLITEGDLHTQSVTGLREANLRGDHDSYFVQRMRAAGFVLVGKTNLPELALGATTEPACWGPARNPWDRSRSTGGSSGGSAAAVAAGMVPVAEGTDGGGSLRMPASHCGVVGLKASRGRISTGPGVFASDGASGMGTEGCLGRSVRDVAAMLDVVSGHRSGDAYNAPGPMRPFVEEVGVDPGRLRIGILTEDATGVAEVDPECVAATRAAADRLADLGHEVKDAFPERLRKGTWPEEFLPSIPMVVKRELARLGDQIGRPLTADDVDPGTWALTQLPDPSAAQYAAGIDSLRQYGADLEGWWEEDGWDLLLTPTMPTPPPLLGSLEHADEGFTESVESLTPETFTVPYNVSGQPAVSLPLHTSSNGLPIGVHLVASYGREDVLIRIASQLEVAIPWSDRRPPVAAEVG